MLWLPKIVFKRVPEKVSQGGGIFEANLNNSIKQSATTQLMVNDHSRHYSLTLWLAR